MKNKTLLNYFSQQVNLYLDNRLNEDGEQNLMNFINTDSECNKVFTTEKNFRDFVKSNAKRPGASKDLIKAIKSQLD